MSRRSGSAEVSSPSRADRTVAHAIARFARVWRVADLARSLDVRFSGRLTATLGRALPASGRVTLHAALRESDPRLLREVLCHEVAHVVAWRSARAAGTPRPKAHGSEWESLVRRAGYTPRRYVLRSTVPQVPPRSAGSRRPARRGWLHVCPVCHFERRAGRPMRRWRCADCVQNGLDGQLLIQPLELGAR